MQPNKLLQVQLQAALANLLHNNGKPAIGRFESSNPQTQFGSVAHRQIKIRINLDCFFLKSLLQQFLNHSTRLNHRSSRCAAFDDLWFQGNDAASTSEKTDHACEAARVAQKEALEARTAKAVGIRLTTREAQVLSCVAEGKQNKLIANRLGLSEHTVKLHIHHVIAKLGVNNRTEAAVWFLENHGSDHLVQ